MKTRHTPGPWKVISPSPARFPSYLVADANGDYVASIEIRAANPAADNASLIAAAPAMLAALREALPLIEDGCYADGPNTVRVRDMIRALPPQLDIGTAATTE